MINNEVIYDHQGYQQYYPKNWREEIRSLSLEEQYAFDCARYKNFQDQNLVDFLLEIEELSQLPLPPLYDDFSFDGKTTFKIKGKKLHEINQILGLLKTQMTNIEGPLIDIGGGVGHLARIITTHLQVPAITIDQNANFHDQGRKRLQKYPLPQGSKPLNFVTGTFSSFEQTNNEMRSHFTSKSFSLGLHTCGPLSLHHFDHVEKSQGCGFLNFGCCYLKLNPKTEVNISGPAKQMGLELSNFALTLASRGNNFSSYSDFVTKFKVKKYRYIIHLLQDELLGIIPLHKIGETHKSFYNNSFSIYAESKLKVLGLKEISKDKIQEFYDNPKTFEKFSHLFAANLIRWRLGRLVEIYILLDRKYYLEEKGFKVQMFPLFDEAISPRNIALMGFRS